jgi:peptidoglycan hydrolase-like protein with peptidoglycan-binding domain
MPDLTDIELQAIAYYAIGVSSEGGDVAYRLSLAGNPVHESDGTVMLKPAGNSGYSIGELQTDLGQRKTVATSLASAFQSWAKANHPDWALTDQQVSKLGADLGRDGHHIRDSDYTSDARRYAAAHHLRHPYYPDGVMPKAGPDIDQVLKARINSYLASDPGKAFVHEHDKAQVNELMRRTAAQLTDAPVYKNASVDGQAKIFAMVAKAYNQRPALASDILDELRHGKLTSVIDISEKIGASMKRNPRHPDQPTYLETGRDAALAGAEVFNALRNASKDNPLHTAWQDVLANPLVDPTKLKADPAQLHLAEEYATVKALFVQPAQGMALVNALEKGASYDYGDPNSAHSRGFYAQGGDFLQWDRDGRGRAYIDDQWSEFSRDDISLVRNHNRTLDVQLTRNGAPENLLHVIHPASRHAHLHQATAGRLRTGARGEAVTDLQNDLHRLGYLDPKDVDGSFGPITRSAVERFQHDSGLVADGIVGAATRQRLDAGAQRREVANEPNCVPEASTAFRGFDDPAHPQHAMYSRLQALLPSGTSQERLHQATATCHMAGMRDPGDLAGIYGGESSIVFTPHSMFGRAAAMDLSQPAPSMQQTLQQVQAFDQQQAQQAMQRLQPINLQQQGPLLSGP